MGAVEKQRQRCFCFFLRFACFRCQRLKCFRNHDDDGIDDDPRVIVAEDPANPKGPRDNEPKMAEK